MMTSSEHDVEKQLPRTHQPNPNPNLNPRSIEVPKRKCRALTSVTDCMVRTLIQIPRKGKARKGTWARHAWLVVSFLTALLLFAFLFPMFALSIFFTGQVSWIDRRMNSWTSSDAAAHGGKEEDDRSSPPTSPLDKTKPETKPVSQTILRLGVISATRSGVLVLIWLILMSVVPALTHIKYHPLIWEWSLFAAVVLLLTPTILLFSYILTTSLSYGLDDTDKIYWIRGVDGSVRWVLYFASVLLLWVFYIVTGLNKLDENHWPIEKKYRSLEKYITPTLVSFLVGSLIGLLKDGVLVWWRVKFIYTDLNRARVLVAAYQLYFLLLLSGSYDEHDQTEIDDMWMVLLWPYHWLNAHDNKLVSDAIKSATNDSTSTAATTSTLRPIEKFIKSILGKDHRFCLPDIDDAATWLLRRFDLSDDETTSTPARRNPDWLIKLFKEKYHYRQNESLERALVESFGSLDSDDAKFLLDVLCRLDVDTDVDFSKKGPLTCDQFEEWMKAAYMNSFVFIHKLRGHFALSNILFRVLSVVQVVVAFIFWLFITQLATARLVVALGSVFLGLTFIFGDTCKTFFQGVVFSFAAHPFDVGDLIEIDQYVVLEVQEIKTLTTVFWEKQTKKTVIYPNSELATKKIVKLTDKPNPGTESTIPDKPNPGTQSAIPVAVIKGG